MRLLAVLLVCYSVAFGQTDPSSEVRNSIETFFKGFHEQDSLLMKSVVSGEIKLQTMGRDKEGKSRLRTDAFPQFLKSICSWPH